MEGEEGGEDSVGRGGGGGGGSLNGSGSIVIDYQASLDASNFFLKYCHPRPFSPPLFSAPFPPLSSLRSVPLSSDLPLPLLPSSPLPFSPLLLHLLAPLTFAPGWQRCRDQFHGTTPRVSTSTAKSRQLGTQLGGMLGVSPIASPVDGLLSKNTPASARLLSSSPPLSWGVDLPRSTKAPCSSSPSSSSASTC
eukprot:143335-Hanusia_phi.AAC.1